MAADEKIVGEAFNFSNEIQITVLELTNRILEIMGKADLRPTVLNEARNEIPHQYLNAEKARQLLNWKPTFTLEKGLEQTINWYRDFVLDQHCKV